MMKIAPLFAFCLMAFTGFSQHSATSEVLEIVQFFDLQPDQKASLESVFAQRAEQIEEIQALKQTDPEKYLSKRGIISEMTFVKVRQILSEQQATRYVDWVREKGKRKNDMFKQLQQSGVSDLELRMKLAELD